MRGAFQSCHLGYKLSEAQINQGLLTEALAEVINYAFTELRLHRIEANIMPGNKRSLWVVEKLGFYYEGLAKKYLKINGSWEDHIHLVLRSQALE
ncbi:MAG TPA: GNAT family N-acetyltransferase [Oscillospiraceae bacterium]|nr:GNAT family N-acetyltransferase [Oscillospiraceae bacterium]